MAVIDIGRIMVHIRCDQRGPMCLLPRSILASGEVAIGILVACVSTFGPLLNPQKFRPDARARRQLELSQQEFLQSRSRSSGREFHAKKVSTTSDVDIAPTMTQKSTEAQGKLGHEVLQDGANRNNTISRPTPCVRWEKSDPRICIRMIDEP